MNAYLPSGEVSSVLELGGGYGAFCDLFVQLALKNNNFRHYILLDIPPMVYVSGQYLRAIYGDRVVTYKDLADKKRITESDIDGKIVVLPSFCIDRFDVTTDLFWNTASFQEMNKAVVRNYLSHVAEKCQHIFVSSKTTGHKLHKFQVGQGDQVISQEADSLDSVVSFPWIERELINSGYYPVPKKDRPVTERVFGMLYSNYTYGMYRRGVEKLAKVSGS